MASITHHPSLTFIIVINPHSGPGAIIGPDANYTREIVRLNSYANVRTIGYVATGYAKRELAAVLQDIAIYSAWSNNATPGLGMQGIFFDETPSQYEPSIAHFLDTAHAAVRSAADFGSQCMVSWFFSFPLRRIFSSDGRRGIRGKFRKSVRIRMGTKNLSGYFGSLQGCFLMIAFLRE